MSFFDLKAAGLEAWADPAQAAAADAASQMQFQAFLIATRNVVLIEWWNTSESRKERKLKQALEELKTTGFMISSLLNAGKQW